MEAVTRRVRWRRSPAADVGDLLLAGGEERHHRAQLGTDRFDGVLLAVVTELVEVGSAGFALRHPFLRELAALDLLQDLLHLRPGAGVDDARSTRDVAVLRRVGD